VDFVDVAVEVDVEGDAGEGAGEFLAQAPGDVFLEFALGFGGDVVEGGDAGLDDVAGAVGGTDADGEGGAEVEESVVFAVAGGAGGGGGRDGGYRIRRPFRPRVRNRSRRRRP
jgi:hypothetical protein